MSCTSHTYTKVLNSTFDIHCFHCIAIFNDRSEGALGFFRGVIPNSLKVAPSAALTFLVYEEVLKLMR